MVLPVVGRQKPLDDLLRHTFSSSSPLDTTNDDDDCETPPKAICSIGYFVSSMLLVASSAPTTCRVLLLAPRRRRRLSTPGGIIIASYPIENSRRRRHRSSSNEDVGHQKNRNENTKSGNVKTTGSDGDEGSTKTGRTRRRSVVRAAAVLCARGRRVSRATDEIVSQRTTPEFACLDLCASHVSHYPYAYAYVLGHGLNREELERNDQFRRGMNTIFRQKLQRTSSR